MMYRCSYYSTYCTSSGGAPADSGLRQLVFLCAIFKSTVRFKITTYIITGIVDDDIRSLVVPHRVDPPPVLVVIKINNNY
jgi:hypothetical protein